MTENQRLEPYVVIIGEETVEAYLVVDKHIIDKFCIIDITFALMAALFVYTIFVTLRGVIIFRHV